MTDSLNSIHELQGREVELGREVALLRGFMEAGTTVTGGQTVMNPWCTIGGVATTICQVPK